MAGAASPRRGGSRKRGVPTGSTRPRSDGIDTVGTDEAAGAGVTVVGRAGRDLRILGGGVSPPGILSRGPAGPKAIVDSRGCCTCCCCCTPASPGGDSVRRLLHRRGRRRARQGRGGRGRARGYNRVSPLQDSLKESAGRLVSRQQGLLRSPCRARWVRRTPKRKQCRLQAKPAAAGPAIDGSDGCRNTSDESPRGSRKAVNPHTWPVCAKSQ